MWVDMSPYYDTLSSFHGNQSLLLLLKATYLAKEQQLPKFIVFGSNPQSIALYASTITITRPMQFKYLDLYRHVIYIDINTKSIHIKLFPRSVVTK